MARDTPHLSFLLLGEQSLLVQCADLLGTRGHHLVGIVTRSSQVRSWAQGHDIPCHEQFELLSATDAGSCDYLLSITNLRMLPGWLLQRARRAAINFHDGPLPRNAGLNAPVWAIINGEASHGVTWHEIGAGADRGRILVQRTFPIAADDTAFSLNAQCYEAGLESFAELVTQCEQDALAPRDQDFSLRTYHGLADRPTAAATLEWRRPAGELARLVRALDFGRYPNPVLLPKVKLEGELLLARECRVVERKAAVQPGTILEVTPSSLTVACGKDALEITRCTHLDGSACNPVEALHAVSFARGSVLPALHDVGMLDAQVRRAAQHEGWWIDRLRMLDLTELPFSRGAASGAPGWIRMESRLPVRTPRAMVASLLLLLARLSNSRQSAVAHMALAAASPGAVSPYFAARTFLTAEFDPTMSWPDFELQVGRTLDTIDAAGPWLSDLPAREPELRAAFSALQAACVCLIRSHVLPADAQELPVTGAALVVAIDDEGQCGVWIGPGTERGSAERLAESWKALLAGLQQPGITCGQVSVLSAHDARQLQQWQVQRALPAVGPVPSVRAHELFEAQVARSPERRAVACEGNAMTYRELDGAANRVAHYLRTLGVGRGALVGIRVPRSVEMLVSLLAVHKAGAAYVPLDPSYPADRLAFMTEDSNLKVVLTHDTVRSVLAAGEYPATTPAVSGDPADLAYVIYTSGTTGRPKGVMVEHRNVVNFFAGMDQRLGTDPGVWLAVTSISFDISVLELLWTLARGFTVVLHGDTLRQQGQAARSAMAIDFGFFYWNVARSEDDYDADKYRLLLESARFADTHGFNAVWTPERHFESFGGLFPNPALTSAALATITKNVKLRAGSCVVPLHSPIRIAEEWAVVDNLSNGRVGMSVASGWAPPDFAIRPESFANAKQVMFESTEIVKRLWRGETVSFPGPKGEVKVRTLPRPIQKELPIWVTTAGNIDTYIQAGKAGANVLTHLLGQTVEEVAEKVVAYREAWTEAGHAGRGVVTLMLHTLVGPNAQALEQIVRQPLKDYLKSALFLVKAAAWQFPTFKKLSAEQGKSLDEFFADISGQDMDDLLEFAFLRYFRTSGLFGTPEHCLDMVRRVKAADADEIACLIDFGINTDTVLEHLPYLDQLRAMAQTSSAGEQYSLASLLKSEAVTHLQCTPTMATMLVADTDSSTTLAGLRHMMVGGEAMPPDLARSLSTLVRGRVSNMYGPTETTVWSTVGTVSEGAITTSNSVCIGEPLLNQAIYVLDEQQQQLPVGVTGELVIGGAGVSRGYWQRPELTAQKFVPDPTQPGSGARMYRTGDLARFLPDGRLECLGRVDQQIKIRGFRVELGEIEALLREQPGIAEAAAVLREVVPGDQRLVGYVRTVDGGDANAEALRTALLKQLPDFMVPSAIVSLRVMPLTLNGKIDRKALPLPTRSAPVVAIQASGSPASVSDAEALVMGIWQRALGVSQIGLRDNFFDIGGHSLLVIQVLAELRDKVSRPIQMTDLFRHTTIETLARFLEGDTQPEAARRGRSRADARRSAMGGRPAAR